VFLQVVISVLLDFSPPLLWDIFFLFFLSSFFSGTGIAFAAAAAAAAV
jgi:hypothetical protein